MQILSVKYARAATARDHRRTVAVRRYSRQGFARASPFQSLTRKPIWYAPKYGGKATGEEWAKKEKSLKTGKLPKSGGACVSRLIELSELGSQLT